MNGMNVYITILLSIPVWLIHSGDLTNRTPDAKKERLVSAQIKETASAEELKKMYGQFSSYIKNGYSAYRITYRTADTDGREVVASGAVFIPDAKSAFPILNYNHGTYFPSKEDAAPSYMGYSYEVMLGKLFSCAGYLVVMPDYIGYGSTKTEMHPYGAYHEIAGSVIDMLRAVKEFCDKNNIVLSGKNFYSGWSEGAAVALATVQMLEKESGEFKPTVAVVNAGPYFSSGFVNYVLDAKKPLTYMNSYAWILQSYNRLYNINKPMSYYFTEPAATNLQENPETYISKDPQELFTQSFINNYKGGKDTALQNALLKNDLWNWKPEARIVLCHGDRDDYVPVFNSEKAYQAMKEKGADVELKIFKGQNHSSGIFQFLSTMFSTFEKAK